MRVGPFVAALAAVSLAGCAANLASVHHEFALRDGNSQLIDVYQRAILVDTDRSDATHHVVCAEPSPDALSVLSASLAGSGKTANVTITASGSMSQAGEAFGLRTQSIQLLRDSYYRLCEAYLSGAIDKFEYDIMLRRYGSDMVALIAIEQLTQAIRPEIQVVPAPAAQNPPADQNSDNTPPPAPQPTTPTPSNKPQGRNTPLSAERRFARSHSTVQTNPLLENASYVVAAAQPAQGTAKPTPTHDTAPTTPVKPAPASKPKPPVAKAAPSPGPGTPQNPPTTDTSSAVAAVQSIAIDILDKDYAGQMCFSYFKSVADASLKDKKPLDQFCADVQKNYLNNQAAAVAIQAAAAQQQAQLATYFRDHCINSATHQTANDATKCSSLALVLAGGSPAASTLTVPASARPSLRSPSVTGSESVMSGATTRVLSAPIGTPPGL